MSLLLRTVAKRAPMLPAATHTTLARACSLCARPRPAASTPTRPGAPLAAAAAPRRHFLGMPSSLSGKIGEQPAPDGQGTIPVVLVSDAKTIWNSFGAIVDVREEAEVAAGAIPGAQNIPLATILAEPNIAVLKGKKVLVYCRAGIRSAKAVQAMRKAGIDAVNLGGGYLAWQGDQK